MGFRESEEEAQRKGAGLREGVARTQVQGTTRWRGPVPPAFTPGAPGWLLAMAQGLQALFLETQPEYRGAAAGQNSSVSWTKGLLQLSPPSHFKGEETEAQSTGREAHCVSACEGLVFSLSSRPCGVADFFVFP